MGVAELSAVLWRERQLLELLLFKLEEEQLVLTSGRSRWLGHATREVEQVLDQIRTAELGRSMEADGAALECGIPAGSGLLALSKAAPEPWDDLLASHRGGQGRLPARAARHRAGRGGRRASEAAEQPKCRLAPARLRAI